MIKNIKTKIRNYVLRTMKSDVEFSKISFLESKVANLERMINDLYPETYIIDSHVQKIIEIYLRKNGINSSANMQVHKKDVMFIFNIHKYKGNFAATFIEYINSGIHQRDVIVKILEKGQKLKSAVKFLDFASGHGRLTRFLVSDIQPSNIWVSDTKEDAIDFQQRTFGVNTFLSSFDPEKLVSPVKFDMIFVASLFSHLPKSLFDAWLKRLISFLDADGILCISAVDNSLYIPDPTIDFHYVEYPDYRVQEEMYEVTEDSEIKAKDLYGVAYVGENYIAQKVNEFTNGKGRYYRYQKALWDLQDIYIIVQNTHADYDNIRFEKYIYT